jgi:hypothetical protein
MHKRLFLLAVLFMVVKAQAQNVGIGTNLPLLKLHIKGGLLLDSTNGTTPVSGAGTRLMWIPAKGAFRAGRALGTSWDDANIGLYSIAIGNGSLASGYGSTAMGGVASGISSTSMGEGTTASGYASTAMGFVSTASGQYSTSMGEGTVSSNYASVAMGGSTTASGDRSTAMGYGSTASGGFSTAMGALTTASGGISTAMGQETVASGDNSTAMGFGTKSKSYGGLTVGLYNDSTNAANATNFNSLNRIFQIGNGTADNARSNAITVLQNGNMGIGELNPGAPLNFASVLGNKISFWGTGATQYGMGIQLSLMQLYTTNTAADIAFGYGSSASFSENMRIKGTGEASIKGNLTVQNGKGLIRSNDGTQQKKVTKDVLVNLSLGAGASTAVGFTFPESFSAAPDVYIGNIVSGSGGWAEVIMSISNITTTGGNLYISNPRGITWSPNYTVRIIAIGPQ